MLLRATDKGSGGGHTMHWSSGGKQSELQKQWRISSARGKEEEEEPSQVQQHRQDGTEKILQNSIYH